MLNTLPVRLKPILYLVLHPLAIYILLSNHLRWLDVKYLHHIICSSLSSHLVADDVLKSPCLGYLKSEFLSIVCSTLYSLVHKVIFFNYALCDLTKSYLLSFLYKSRIRGLLIDKVRCKALKDKRSITLIII